MVDRSIVVGELNLDREAGVQVFSDDFLGLGGKFRYQAGVFGGDGRNRTSSAPGTLWVGRFQYQPFGSFDDSSETDFERSSQPHLALSGGAAFNQNTNRLLSTFGGTYQFARFNYRHLHGDILFKWTGFSFLAELMSRKATEPFAEAFRPGRLEREWARSAWGYFVQPAYLFRNGVEVAARYGKLRPMGLTDPALFPGKEVGSSLSPDGRADAVSLII
jgi:hypothetical protein